MTSRRWCFTINNPIDTDFPQQWPQSFVLRLKLLIVQLEQGTEGTVHLQGYLEMLAPTRLAAMKKYLPRAHLSAARSERLTCIQYCLKTETSLNRRWWLDIADGLQCFAEDLPPSLEKLMQSLSERKNGMQSSTRSRLLAIQSTLCSGSSATIEQVADEDFDIWVRYYRAFEKYLLMKSVPRSHKTSVTVIQGPTGTGKSKWAYDFDNQAYWKQRSQWWCGYTTHETVVLDEFYGWIPFDLLLRLCDRYPMLVETKGGQVQFVAKNIIITTNMLPSTWYKSAYFPAFVRRVDNWICMPVWGEIVQTVDYAEFARHASDNILTP